MRRYWILITYLILLLGCLDIFIPECSTISGRPAYSGSIITDQSFEEVVVAKDDTVFLRPEYNLHGFNKYVGDEACDGESYELRPNFRISDVDEAVVSAELYNDSDGEPRYDDEFEVKIRIIGLESGETSIKLEASFWYYNSKEDLLAEEVFEIFVEVQN